MFIEGEIVIVNNKVSKGLPSRVGESAMIIENLIDSPNYNYRIEFLDGQTAKVKESEINKLTEIDKYYMSFVYAGNNAIYVPVNEEVQIITVDYLHCKAEVEFVSGGVTVVDFDRLMEIGFEDVYDETELVVTREQLHRNVIEEIHNTFIIKNADYGNSFGEQYEEYGLLSALIRLDDKMRRLKQLNKQQAQVKDESIRDTVLDLANYAIMTVMELDKNN